MSAFYCYCCSQMPAVHTPGKWHVSGKPSAWHLYCIASRHTDKFSFQSTKKDRPHFSGSLWGWGSRRWSRNGGGRRSRIRSWIRIKIRKWGVHPRRHPACAGWGEALRIRRGQGGGPLAQPHDLCYVVLLAEMPKVSIMTWQRWLRGGVADCYTSWRMGQMRQNYDQKCIFYRSFEDISVKKITKIFTVVVKMTKIVK